MAFEFHGAGLEQRIAQRRLVHQPPPHTSEPRRIGTTCEFSGVALHVVVVRVSVGWLRHAIKFTVAFFMALLRDEMME